MNNNEKNNNKKTSKDTQTQTKENIFLQALNYYEGKGIKQDYAKAFAHFELALKQGYLESQYYLAICHEIGLGTKSDKKKALEYYYRAAIQNNDKAQLFIGNYYNQQNSSEAKKKAIYWYELSSKCGNKEASQILELLYSKNNNSKEKIEQKPKTQKPSAKKTTAKTTIKTTTKTTTTENASSQNPYTTCYLKATCENDAKAQYELALLFQSGKYIQKNEKQAFCFFEKSANQNYIPAKIELAKCYTIGSGTGKNLKKAFDLYQIAANAGNPDAQNILGNYYMTGNAGGLKIPKDVGRALEYWTKAAKQGLAQAKASLNTYDRKKDILVWNKLEKKEYYLAPATKNNLSHALDMLDNPNILDKIFSDFEENNQILITYKGDLRDILNFQVHIQINDIGESVYYILLKINVYSASRIFGTTYDSFPYDETYKDQNHFYEYQTSDRKKVEYILLNFIEKEELPPYTKSPWYDRKLLPSINLKKPLPAAIFTCFDNFKFHYDEAYENLLKQQSSPFLSDHLDSVKSALSCAANPMGVYITWMIKADLLSSVQRETHKKAIEEVLKNQISGLDFILNYCGGMLTSEDFNELGTAFTKYYYPKYLNDYLDYSKQKYHAVYKSTNTYLDFKGLELKIDNAFSYFINSLS